MKRKILCVALAMTMLFSLVAVTANASIAEGRIFGLSFTENAITASKGDTVSVTFRYEGAEGFQSINGGAFDFAYNADVLVPASAPSFDGAAYGDFITNVGYTSEQYSAANSLVYDTTSQDETIIGADTYGYTQIARVGITEMVGNYADASKGFNLFTLNFKVADDAADGTYRVALYTDALTNIDKLFNYINVEGYDSCYEGCMGTVYGLANDDDPAYDTSKAYVDITIGEDAKPITFVKTQAQWANGENYVQDTWKLGIVGKFKTSDIDIAFNDAGTSTNVSAVGVDVTAGDYTVTETTKYVYETATGEYSYRAVITGIPADVAADKTITVTFFAMVGSEKVTGETKTINLADALATAQANGMAKAD